MIELVILLAMVSAKMLAMVSAIMLEMLLVVLWDLPLGNMLESQ